MFISYICIGANVGNRQKYIDDALTLLNKIVNIRNMSSIIETDPIGHKNQNPFLNTILEIETDLSPHSLLKKLKDIEIHIGRKTRYRWGPREIDLDILLYEDRVINTDGLTIPHPEMHNRKFVRELLDEMGCSVPRNRNS